MLIVILITLGACLAQISAKPRSRSKQVIEILCQEKFILKTGHHLLKNKCHSKLSFYPVQYTIGPRIAYLEAYVNGSISVPPYVTARAKVC